MPFSSGQPARFHPVRLGILIAWLISTLPAISAPIRDYPTTLTQPDGSSVKALLSGDEYFNWAHDKNGYVIMQDRRSGLWVYAAKDGDDIAPTAFIAGKVDPASVGLTPNALPSPDGMASLRKEKLARRYSDDGPSYAPTQGTLSNIVIYIRFKDQTEFTTSTSTYDAMFNGTTSNSSMRNYFKEVSFTKLTVNTYFYPTTTGSTVVSYQDSQPRAYYEPYNATSNPIGYQDDSQAATREHTLLAAAVNAVGSQVPTTLNLDIDSDGRVDNVCFVVKGSPGAWADLLWPHKWSLYTQYVTLNGKRVYTYNLQLENHMLYSSGVGVLCHEMFHSLGAPDLYHYSYDGYVPVGPWDVMENNQEPPQHMSAYMKYRYGRWITSIPEITTSGSYSLNPLTYPTNNCWKIKSPNSTTEYFVLEYRLKSGKFENSLPGSGLLVYRVNTRYDGNGNASGPPDELYVYRPGGSCTTNGSVSSAYLSSNSGRKAINDYTNPKSFLSNCEPAGLNIDNIGTAGTTITFDVHIMTGTARRVVFQAVPAQTYAGDLLSPQPVVKIVDSQGAVVQDSTAPVTISIKANSGANGATLLGTTTVNAVGGIATFTDLAVDLAGTGYVLTASSPNLVSSDCASFTIARRPTTLVYTAQPGDAFIGHILSPAPVLEIRDSLGERVSDYSGSVSISIKPGTGSSEATLGGILTTNAVKGIASFGDLTLNKAATGYVLTAVTGTLPPVDSSPFSVIRSPMGFLSQTGPNEVTVSLDPADRTVQICDFVIAFPTADLTTPTASDVTPSANWAYTFVESGAGMVRFWLDNWDGVSSTGPAAKIRFTPVSGVSGRSIPIRILTTSNVADNEFVSYYLAENVLRFVPGGKLAFTAQPGHAEPGLTIPGPPIISLRDGTEADVTDVPSMITISLKPGSGNPTAALSGTRKRSLAGGLASFNDLSVDLPGSDYALVATADGFSPAESMPFNVGAVPFVVSDVVSSLRWAAGLDPAPADGIGRLNVARDGESAEVIDAADAIVIARKIAGLDSNP
jgi:M6 family metalloprotease-like protein